MLFTEPTFLFAFLPLLLAIYYVTPIAARNALLVVASVLFYARDGGAFTWLILASIVINTVAAVWVDRLRGTPAAKRLLVLIVGLNLLSLATFKYSGFLIDNLNLALDAIGRGPLAAPELLLPIGISFFTFHSISYIVDVYRRQAVAQKGPVGAALYLLFFPQLIAGPIIRYKDIAAQINARAAHGERLRARRAAVHHRPRQEAAGGGHRRPSGRRHLRAAARRADGGARVARRRLLHAPDLLRLLGLLGHGHRPGPHVRLHLPGELPLPLRRFVGAGLLEALAHLAVVLVPRLPLHPARRQPRARRRAST